MSFWRDIPKPIIGLSPMDGVTDASFRYIAAKHGGPDVILTEFVNAETVFLAPHTVIKDFTYSEIERPAVAQIYGHTPELFYKAAHIVCELGFDGLDINMGCPAKKVAAKGSGAALIRTPELARAIIRAARRGIADWRAGQTLEGLKIEPAFIAALGKMNRRRSGVDAPSRARAVPVSVKTRIGYDRVVVEEWIENLLEERPAAIALHGRTLKQGYRGDADWRAIARAAAVARNSDTLILGNGDLRDMEDVYRRVRETGVDGVLLGRAAQGNPWIFKAKDSVKAALRANDVKLIEAGAVGLAERFHAILEHSEHFADHWGLSSFVAMRKHFTWYCKASPRAAELRARMVRVNSPAEAAECLKSYAAFLGSDTDHDPRFTQELRDYSSRPAMTRDEHDSRGASTLFSLP